MLGVLFGTSYTAPSIQYTGRLTKFVFQLKEISQERRVYETVNDRRCFKSYRRTCPSFLPQRKKVVDAIRDSKFTFIVRLKD